MPLFGEHEPIPVSVVVGKMGSSLPVLGIYNDLSVFFGHRVNACAGVEREHGATATELERQENDVLVAVQTMDNDATWIRNCRWTVAGCLLLLSLKLTTTAILSTRRHD